MIEVPELARQAEVVLAASQTALIVVDMQNDFAHKKGALFVPDAVATIPAIKKLLKQARSKGVRVVYTQDWHPEADPEFAIWPRHVVQGTWGAQIVKELAPQEGETVVQKARYDGFYGTQLDHLLHLWGIKQVVIVGTVANICVLHTAGSAALRWYKVILPQDGTSALNPFDLEAALRQVWFLYQGIITTCAGVRFE
jgi:nicotinamidase-related amidase